MARVSVCVSAMCNAHVCTTDIYIYIYTQIIISQYDGINRSDDDGSVCKCWHVVRMISYYASNADNRIRRHGCMF